MPRPNLLLCFDAFGTLFKPRPSVVEQYGRIARQMGITNFDDCSLEASLRLALKHETKMHPNYGKAIGLGATQWWTNVIHGTFAPFMRGGKDVPADLATRLISRFSCDKGYEAAPNLASALRAIKSPSPHRLFENAVVGIITNSDDRVPNVLASFGVSVSKLRCGIDSDATAASQGGHDIDFHCMSYDVGVEKPDRRIFEAAQDMLTRIVPGSDAEAWVKVHVGDDFDRDVVGAAGAGWNSVLLPDGHSDARTHLPRLEDHVAQTIEGLFRQHQAVSVGSLRALASWLTGTTFPW